MEVNELNAAQLRLQGIKSLIKALRTPPKPWVR